MLSNMVNVHFGATVFLKNTGTVLFTDGAEKVDYPEGGAINPVCWFNFPDNNENFRGFQGVLPLLLPDGEGYYSTEIINTCGAI